MRFSSDGKYLAAAARRPETVQSWDSLRVWNIESGQAVVSVDGIINDATFAAGDRVLVVSTTQGIESKLWFWDLARPDQPPRVATGFGFILSVTATADGALVGSSTTRGSVELFDPFKGELIESIQAHLNAVFGVAFSSDGRRLLSASGGREAVKLWDVQMHQELLTLSGTGSALMNARWSPDGNLILAGPPWQVWRAPSWAEIAASEAKHKQPPKGP
jgi:WD40 repeat protein